MSYLRSIAVALCALCLVNCGDSAMPAPDKSADESDADERGGGDSPAADAGSGSVPVPQFGGVALEAIEEDGSDAGIDVSPVLVERIDEARAALPMLARAKLQLSLVIQAHKLRDESKLNEVFALVEEANELDVPVKPVPILSGDDGYFPNATNAATFASAARELVQRWKARGLSPSTLVVDMEPPRELIEALGSLDLATAAPDDHIDRARFEVGRREYTTLVDELHREGFKVAITTQGSLIGDYVDADDDLRQYFNVVLEGPAWDEIEFQLYRSVFQRQAPGLGPHFVYDFARTAIMRFPDTAVGVAVGVTHPGPVFPDTATIGSPDELRKDTAAALAAGVPRERIGVYNMKGILLGPPKCEELLGCEANEYEYGANSTTDWLTPASEVKAPDSSPATGVLWTQLGLMDKLLDVMKAVDPTPN